MPFKRNKPEDFWNYVNKDGPVSAHRPELGKCWVWTGSVRSGGYGSFTCSGKAYIASRYSLEMKIRQKLSRNLFACHACDNPPCVNPDHLFVGTAKDNGSDSASKGRTRGQKATHCARGHELAGENLHVYIDKRGRKERKCRQCNRDFVKNDREAGGERRRRAEYRRQRKLQENCV